MQTHGPFIQGLFKIIKYVYKTVRFFYYIILSITLTLAVSLIALGSFIYLQDREITLITQVASSYFSSQIDKLPVKIETGLVKYRYDKGSYYIDFKDIKIKDKRYIENIDSVKLRVNIMSLLRFKLSDIVNISADGVDLSVRKSGKQEGEEMNEKEKKQYLIQILDKILSAKYVRIMRSFSLIELKNIRVAYNDLRVKLNYIKILGTNIQVDKLGFEYYSEQEESQRSINKYYESFKLYADLIQNYNVFASKTNLLKINELSILLVGEDQDDFSQYTDLELYIRQKDSSNHYDLGLFFAIINEEYEEQTSSQLQVNCHILSFNTDCTIDGSNLDMNRFMGSLINVYGRGILYDFNMPVDFKMDIFFDSGSRWVREANFELSSAEGNIFLFYPNYNQLHFNQFLFQGRVTDIIYENKFSVNEFIIEKLFFDFADNDQSLSNLLLQFSMQKDGDVYRNYQIESNVYGVSRNEMSFVLDSVSTNIRSKKLKKILNIVQNSVSEADITQANILVSFDMFDKEEKELMITDDYFIVNAQLENIEMQIVPYLMKRSMEDTDMTLYIDQAKLKVGTGGTNIIANEVLFTDILIDEGVVNFDYDIVKRKKLKDVDIHMKGVGSDISHLVQSFEYFTKIRISDDYLEYFDLLGSYTGDMLFSLPIQKTSVNHYYQNIEFDINGYMEHQYAVMDDDEITFYGKGLIDISKKNNQPLIFNIDLLDSELNLPILQYQKNKTDSLAFGGELDISLEKMHDKILKINNVRLKGDNIDVKAQVELRNLIPILFDLSIDNLYGNDLALMMKLNKNDQFDINVTSSKLLGKQIKNYIMRVKKSFDKREKQIEYEEVKDKKEIGNIDNQSQLFNIDLDLNKVVALNNHNLREFRGNILCSRQYCSKGMIDFWVENLDEPNNLNIDQKKDDETITEEPFGIISFFQYKNSNRILFESNNVGSLLSSMGITNSVTEGLISLEFLKNIDKTWEGKLYAYNLYYSMTKKSRDRFRKMTVEYDKDNKDDKILQTLSEKKFDFLSELNFAFKFDQGGVYINDLIGVAGTSWSVTADGFFDFQDKILNLDGNLSPLFRFTSGISSFPLYGKLFTGKKGEGILGINYTLEGDMKKKEWDLNINPISILTPGVLRYLYQK